MASPACWNWSGDLRWSVPAGAPIGPGRHAISRVRGEGLRVDVIVEAAPDAAAPDRWAAMSAGLAAAAHTAAEATAGWAGATARVRAPHEEPPPIGPSTMVLVDPAAGPGPRLATAGAALARGLPVLLPAAGEAPGTTLVIGTFDAAAPPWAAWAAALARAAPGRSLAWLDLGGDAPGPPAAVRAGLLGRPDLALAPVVRVEAALSHLPEALDAALHGLDAALLVAVVGARVGAAGLSAVLAAAGAGRAAAPVVLWPAPVDAPAGWGLADRFPLPGPAALALRVDGLVGASAPAGPVRLWADGAPGPTLSAVPDGWLPLPPGLPALLCAGPPPPPDAPPLTGAAGWSRRWAPVDGPLRLADAAGPPPPHGPGAAIAVTLRAEAPLHRPPWSDGLLDAATTLAEPLPDDRPADADALRLDRIARHLRAAGFTILHPPPPPRPIARPRRWACGPRPAGGRSRFGAAWRRGAALGAWRWARARLGPVQLDNHRARDRLRADIDAARREILAQWYLVDDDPTTAALLSGLAAAARRGVQVCVLVDALFGARAGLDDAPALSPLRGVPGITLRRARPPEDRSGVAGLKLRDHRKLLIIDGVVATVGGRNLGAPYYTGLREVAVAADTPYREVPWLDAGLVLRGRAAHALRATFAAAWAAAAGPPLPHRPIPPTARRRVALCVHHGLADAHTLETWRWLIDTARARLLLVNTFPVAWELAAALHRALDRGVALTLLVGEVRPQTAFGDPLPGGAARELASAVIHGRLIPLVAHGARVVVPVRPTAGLAVRPHIHAKIGIADGRRLLLGSANLDLSSAVWEDELLVLVPGRRPATTLEAGLSAWARDGAPLHAEAGADPSVDFRTWLSRVWPGLLG
jgi:phosphatidylserine/phosphatidylglycerophosphate/cardiolipin synthase-like enzyme